MKGFLILLILLYLSFFNIALAANPLDVIINEIAWMGMETSANDEWIELYNNAENSINLDGWQLVAQDGTPKINLSGTILANGFYLLERTDDTTVPNIPANQIYTGALSNDGENLGLYDNFGNLIDSLNCSSGWFVGDNSTKQTMERVNSENWRTSQNPGGTPNAKNSVSFTIEPPPPTPEEPEPLVETQPELQSVTYPFGIIINELIPSPEGADEMEEWIELLNKSDNETDLSGWQISDTKGAVKTYTFAANTKISGQGFLVLKRPETKITLNNDSDGLQLIKEGNIIDEVNYTKAKTGQSFNKTESGWAWSEVLTPGAKNIISLPAPASKNEEKTPEKEEIKNENSLAEVKAPFAREKTEENHKSSFFLLAGLPLALFSGFVVLILKKNLKNTSNID